ncbi:hypothetical protein A5N86_12845 [Geobacillus thermoleovorans]|jgi:hypothetical protein|uniref:Uncharacterized protein n=1 Tax=Geobacillus kaustophilus (strain HTA426) TaxID=235909 RepID=Q5L213_GEOKA|nr:hypothetical protein IB49_13940 [Geobacillus sp. LC300]AOL33612.1 hypothetical protein BGM21_03270 [Geobacillus thermoleovorans]KDE48916.1 hypothetical protein DI43_02160 [Geobacillus sp. CAMR12739]OPX04264.1 hypothetical protein B1A75_04065 [Geobacillus sp. LEMMY01]BAD75017.1 hypothetical protein GK0732 [Geobacillus kaustophilus HTA426]
MRYSAIRKGVLSLLGHSFDKFEFSNKIAEHLEKMDEILARFPYQISLGAVEACLFLPTVYSQILRKSTFQIENLLVLNVLSLYHHPLFFTIITWHDFCVS